MEFRQRKVNNVSEGQISKSTTNPDEVRGYFSFYKKAPSGSITLQQFEHYATERLKVLKAIELNGVLRGKKFEDYCDKMKEQFTDLGWQFLWTSKLSNEEEEKDLVSHHILRLAYAKSESKRQWFVAQETELLKLRLYFQPKLLSGILEVNNLNSEQVPAQEVMELSEQLQGCLTGLSFSSVYYKVDFEEVLQLVAVRKVYLSQGHAYLPAKELQSFVLNKYKMYLKEQLAIACRLLPGLEEENRIMKKLEALSGGDLGTGYKTRESGEKITADMLDSLSLRSYPLCMQMLHNHIMTKHHAKHDGRMQYGLFIKGIGLSLEESLKFWRTQFCKSGMDPDKFDKNYSYNVRHNYGKEGKRTDYTPHSCMKIIGNSEPKGEECHGCPYKHNDELSLRQVLEKRKISAEAMEEVVSLKKQGHYQVACMSLFKATHPKEGLQGGLQHPNQYFEESQAILNGTHSPEQKVKQEPESSSNSNRTADKENIEHMTGV